MWEKTKENVVAPLARRVGTMAGVAALAWGLPHEVADALTLIATFVLLTGVDLVVSFAERKRTKEETAVETLMGNIQKVIHK